MYPNNDFEKLDLIYRFFAWSQVLDETNETKETLGMDNCDMFRGAMSVKIRDLEKVVLKSICERLKSKIKRDVVECLDGENNGKGSYDILFKDIPALDYSKRSLIDDNIFISYVKIMNIKFNNRFDRL